IMFESGDEADAIIAARGLEQVSDTGAIEAVVDQVIADNPDKVAEYQGGKDKLMGWFVGQVMKASQGKANPQMANEVLSRKLSG
ncbi:MAG: Asp-tRNA(Asn)/Glu-tRNA(Gln) amidotransferase GatCAB subunit B, partial [Alphaproteobacteria bacterium]|nr:Asp-tRNA(Asn)/Glu-tRNA(Gln) amidotransferase GatCAB subunit B [Alphaproteobacteria bacterium]